MTTSQVDTSLPSADAELDVFDAEKMRYMASLSRHLAHEFLLDAFVESGLTKADIARRLGSDPSRVGRQLNVPTNMTVETLGELLYAINGTSPVYGCLDHFSNPRPNYGSEDWCHAGKEIVTIEKRDTNPISWNSTVYLGPAPDKKNEPTNTFIQKYSKSVSL